MMFSAFMSLAGISVVSGQLKYFYIAILLVSMFIFISDGKKRIKGYVTAPIIVFCFFVAFCYWITQFLYDKQPSSEYFSQIFAFGAKCIPAVIVGMHFMKYPCMERIDKLLPFVVLPVGLIIGTYGYVTAMQNEIVNDEDASGGLNYQTLSYYMAELYSFAAYYIFFSSAKNTKVFFFARWIMFAAMLFFATVCFMSGGRGAMVFIVFISGFIVYTLLKTRKKNRFVYFLLICAILLIFLLIFNRLNIADSAGFNRVVNGLTKDDIRIGLKETAIASFWDSPVFGHGIGSVWWEVGYYTHNVFLDLLVETGIIGTLVFVFCYAKVFLRLWKLSMVNNTMLFILFIFLEITVETAFSGYWISSYALWMVFSMMFVLTRQEYNRLINNKMMCDFLTV